MCVCISGPRINLEFSKPRPCTGVQILRTSRIIYGAGFVREILQSVNKSLVYRSARPESTVPSIFITIFYWKMTSDRSYVRPIMLSVYKKRFVFVSVVLLDTTTEPSLRWTTYPYGPDANAAGVSLNCITILSRATGGKKETIENSFGPREIFRRKIIKKHRI